MRTLNVGVEGDQNELPHVLVPHLDQTGWCGISWKLQCPYEGIRPCGVLVPCTDPAHAGPHPPHEPESWDDPSPAWKKYWEDYEAWREECPTSTHPGPECWYQHVLAVGDEEPEYFLAELPEGPITGPLQVAVSTTGYDDDLQIHFHLFTTPEE